MNSITRSKLQIIASISMFIDHFTAIVFPVIFQELCSSQNGNFQNSFFYIAGRIIGRLSFPIYCFMISEGAVYSKNKKNYLIRMLCLAVISIPFHGYATSGKLFNFSESNVLFGLASGLLAIICIDYIDKKYKDSISTKAMLVGKFALVIFFCALVTVLRVEYYGLSVLLICAFYYARKEGSLLSRVSSNFKIAQLTWAIAAFLVGSFEYFLFALIFEYGGNYPLGVLAKTAIMGMKKELVGIAALIIIYFYNGKKGRNISKNFFYIFYPAHMLILKLLAQVIAF